MKETMLQTWSPFSIDLSGECSTVFEKALSGYTGYHYTPLACSTQLVAGMNYKYFCNAKGTYPNALNQSALITIYVPADDIENPHITSIKML